MKRIFSLLLAVLMMGALFVGCQPKETATDAPTVEEGKLIMGLDDSFPPMGYRNEDNEIVGFDIDLATEVAKRLDLELVLQPIEWASKEMELESGTIDLVWNGMTITDKRKEDMLMSRPYVANTQIILVLEGSDIQAKADLEGRVVGLQEGSSAVEALNADPIKDSVADVTEFKDYITALTDLKTGGVEAVIIDSVVGEYYYTLEAGTFRILEDELAEEEYGIGFKKGNQELHDAVMGAIDEMIADGTAATISEKWFSRDVVLGA